MAAGWLLDGCNMAAKTAPWKTPNPFVFNYLGCGKGKGERVRGIYIYIYIYILHTYHSSPPRSV
jgi:hypothetical protein